MTQEEKAKAYDEALEKARNLYPGLHSHNKAMLEVIFPELRESEDERIRVRLEGLDVKSIPAWLERQKENATSFYRWYY